MGKIHRLSSDEIKKIAAGEVVERPANIVKELVENALDAGGTKVDIYIEQAGKQLIRVVDNGCGMSQEDAHTCFEQHATSKLQSVEQLQTISTYGFRGEALSSIASVSKVTLITKEASAAHGTKITLEYGQSPQEDISSAPDGTDVSIAEIFSNVPARKKFLKTNATEWNQIVQLFQAFCLTYPEAHFTLYHEQRMIHNCPPVDERDKRVMQLWDHVSPHMLPISGADAKLNLKVYGCVSNHQYSRYSRNQIFLFVNNRWIKNPKLSRALLRGYTNVHPPGKYPAAFLFMEIDKEQVDINIHPRKEEVQFLHSRIVEQTITRSVKGGLEMHLSNQLQPATPTFAPATKSSDTFPMDDLRNNFSPTLNLLKNKFELSDKSPKTEDPFEDLFDQGDESGDISIPKFQQISLKTDENKNDGSIVDDKKVGALSANLEGVGNVTQQALEQIIQKSIDQVSYQVIGQLFKTYLLIERDEQLIMIDQHAAHERVLYELFSKKFETIATVNLMFPQTIHLSAHAFALILPFLDLLVKHGIGVEVFGDTQLIVTSTPVNIKNVDLQQFVQQIIGWIEEHDQVDEELFTKQLNEHVHSHMACKAAIKAGDVLEDNQIHRLIEDLEKSENRLTCPHGRPTMWAVSQGEIEKKFKRKL